WPVFMALTISGGLQAGMVLVTLVALLALLCRAAVLGLLDYRWLKWLKKNTQRHSPRAVLRLAALLDQRAQHTLGLALPSLAGVSLYWNAGTTSASAEKGQERMLQVVEENDQGSYLVSEM